SAIFQEDCKIISESPPQIVIKLRPYSKDMGCEDLDISALLVVRCLPGYPYKCPKLQIAPERGLSKSNADNLQSLLHDLANSNAREGRVMIFNLVEAAQEFLSAIVPVDQSRVSVQCASKDSIDQIKQDLGQFHDKASNPRVPFVYGFLDLFSGLGESWHWGFGMDGNPSANSSLDSNGSNGSKLGHQVVEKKIDKSAKTPVMNDAKKGPAFPPVAKLDVLEEESEYENKVTDSDNNGSMNDQEDVPPSEYLADTDDIDLESFSVSLASASTDHDQVTHTVGRDLIMVHLLRLACSSKGQLSDALPEITSELYNLGIFSESIRDLAAQPSTLFNKTFDHVFRQHMVSSKISEFWNPASDFEEPNMSATSRYLNDFEELQSLGHGGFGHVVLCKNKLDGRQYAVKKIRLKDKSLDINDRILREVATLSRLQHQHVVRYYQAWFETGVRGSYPDTPWVSVTPTNSFSHMGANSSDVIGRENLLESTYLYIQMEYCPRTLGQDFESYEFDKEMAWHLFRQIVEGLVHIHGQGIIHRDLTPSNIFFDSRNDIKIGDFGLAKFLKLEQLDQDTVFPPETSGASVDGTGQVGTYFYTAPEIEQGWPKIDEKADMYSLGVVFFELWHPFGTAMERQIILSDLKLKGVLPSGWVADFPEQASLLQRLMSPIPSDRPSATELLENFLRTMRNTEDTTIYDKVVNSIFSGQTSISKDRLQQVGVLRLAANDTSSIQYTDLVSELRGHVAEVTKEVFRRHCAKHLEIIPIRLLHDYPQFHRRNTVKLLTQGGDMVELCHELRFPFVTWVIANQKLTFKRYEISHVYRRAIGHSPPNHYLQGDFDIIGGASALTEAEVIKVTMDILTRFFHPDSCGIHLNHGDLLDAIWSWAGIKPEHRQKVAELLSMMASLCPQSSARKTKWVVIRRQLLQFPWRTISTFLLPPILNKTNNPHGFFCVEYFGHGYELNLADAVVNRLQTVGLRFCGIADQALPRLRGALPADKRTQKALDELSNLYSYLRVWRIEKHVVIDALMPPTESYHRDLFFQIYLAKENNSVSLAEGLLLAVGGRYDFMLHQLSDWESKSSPSGGVGTSLALETIIRHSSTDFKPARNEGSISVLVCSRGGGGLLEERMELVAELWDENIKAEFVPMSDPSLTEQYEYASEHDIKCLIIVTDAGVSQTGSVKVRHLELKREKEVDRENLVQFLLDAMTSQFKNPSIWN
ncbi:RWD domain, partial [Dillenia turbinata]